MQIRRSFLISMKNTRITHVPESPHMEEHTTGYPRVGNTQKTKKPHQEVLDSRGLEELKVREENNSRLKFWLAMYGYLSRSTLCFHIWRSGLILIKNLPPNKICMHACLSRDWPGLLGPRVEEAQSKRPQTFVVGHQEQIPLQLGRVFQKLSSSIQIDSN